MVKVISMLSGWLMHAERAAVRAIAVALPLMIIANAVARALRSPIYWMDELAILMMVWMAMIAMSLTLKTRDAVSVTMLVDAAPPVLMKGMKILVDLLVLAFGVILLVLCYRWFDPITLMRTGFDTHAFSGETFNFMYEDTTNTLGAKKFWFWLVIPLVALTTTIHAASNLLQTLAAPASVMANHLPASAVGAE